MAVPKVEAGPRRYGHFARCKAKPARPRPVQSPNATVRSPHAAGFVSQKARSKLQRSRRRRARRRRQRRAGRQTLHKAQAGSHVHAWLDARSRQTAPTTIHRAVRIKERKAARASEKGAVRAAPLFRRGGRGETHSWGCRRWNSPVAPKPKRFDRDSPRPHRRTLHSEWGMLKKAEIAELGEPPPSALGNARAAFFAPA